MPHIRPGALYALLLLVLAALVWWQPILWELGIVGALAGAAWWLTRPPQSGQGEDSGNNSA
jgi:hypothetical protein